MSNAQPAAQQAAPITPATRAKAEDNLRKAKVQLVVNQPFFASIVLRRKIEIKDSMPTACVTPAGRIYLGTAFFASLTVAECVFILAHESMHYAMLHHQRVGWRKPRAANVAMDKVINDILIASNVGTAPKQGIFQDGAREYAWEQLYDENDNGGGGGSDGPYQPGTGHDDLSSEGMADLSKDQIEQIKQELIQARQASQKAGKTPAGMDELIDRIVNPPVPYHQLLERFMLHMIKTGTSWRRRNKRFAAHDLCMPSYDMKPKMGTVVIQLDESGSIDKDMLANFAMHTNDLIALCNPERVIVLHTSTEVAKVEEFTAEDYPIEFRAATTGGTHMPAGFDWVDKNGEEPDVFVCLTDGYTEFGDPPPYPVVWLITTPDLQATHGETIFTEVC